MDSFARSSCVKIIRRQGPKISKSKGMETCFSGVYLKIMPHYLWLDSGSTSSCRIHSQHRKKMHFQFLFPANVHSSAASSNRRKTINLAGILLCLSARPQKSVACKCIDDNEKRVQQPQQLCVCVWGNKSGGAPGTVHLHSN